MLINKYFAVYFKTNTQGRSTSSQLLLSRKWRRQTKMRRWDQLFKSVFHLDWGLSPHFANWNHQNVTRMFQECFKSTCIYLV